MHCELCQHYNNQQCALSFTSMFGCTQFQVKLPNSLQLLDDMSDGAHLKYWVSTLDGRRGLYKIAKQTTMGAFTFEHVSEALAWLIGRCIGVPVCDIVLYDNAVLSLEAFAETLYPFLAYSEEFTHSYHMSNLQTFDISSLLNPQHNAYVKEVLQMLLFDILIGNSDRHPGNFALTSKGFYPLYDNGSSLCAYVNEQDIDSLLRDSMHWQALMFGKSKPVLRADQRLTHYALLQILKESYPEEVTSFSRRLLNLDIKTVLDQLTGYISPKRYQLLTRFLAERKAWFYE